MGSYWTSGTNWQRIKYTTIVAIKKSHNFLDLCRLTHMYLLFGNDNSNIYICYFFCCDVYSLLGNLMFMSFITVDCANVDIFCISNMYVFMYIIKMQQTRTHTSAAFQSGCWSTHLWGIPVLVLVHPLQLYSSPSACSSTSAAFQPGCLSSEEDHGLLTRYVKLRVAHAPGIPGMFSSPPTSKETAI